MNEHFPRVSIIVPCFNYGAFIAETLNSLLNQDFEEWECIIVDDGSSDNTKAICSRFLEQDSRFVYLGQENKGLAAARNLGISQARGEFLQFLDADDLISEGKLGEQIKFMNANPTVDISYGNAFYFKDPDKSTLYRQIQVGKNDQLFLSQEPWIEDLRGQGNHVIRSLIYGNLAPICNYLFKRAVFDKVGFFDTNFKSLEDWEFVLRCAINDCTFSYFNSNSSCYIRVHTSSLTQDRSKMAFYYVALMGKYLNIINKRRGINMDEIMNNKTVDIIGLIRNNMVKYSLFSRNHFLLLWKLTTVRFATSTYFKGLKYKYKGRKRR